MPSAWQGNTTVPTAPVWTASTSKSVGDFVQPTALTGQYFECTAETGPTGSSEPAWSTPSALPVPGTTFTDGGVTWTCMGSILVPGGSIVVDIPLDGDPSLTAVVSRALQNLANYLEDLPDTYGLLAGDNTWTGTNTFDDDVTFNGSFEQFVSSLAIFSGTYGGPTTIPLYFSVAPTTRLCIFATAIGNGMYARLYADHVAGLSSFGGLTFTINASWSGSAWSQDNTGFDASLYYLDTDDFAAATWPGGTSFSSAAYVMNLSLASGGIALVMALGDIALSAGNILFTGSGQTLDGWASAHGGQLQLDSTASLGGAVTHVAGDQTQGTWGVATTVFAVSGAYVDDSAAVDIFGGSGNVPGPGLYKIVLATYNGAGATTASLAGIQSMYIGYPGFTANNLAQLDSVNADPPAFTYSTDGAGAGNAPTSGIDIPFYATGSGAVQCYIQAGSGQSFNVTAAIVAIA